MSLGLKLKDFNCICLSNAYFLIDRKHQLRNALKCAHWCPIDDDLTLFQVTSHYLIQVPGVSSPVGYDSYPESTRCCGLCVIPFSWCQSVFWRMGHGRKVSTLPTAVGGESRLWYSGTLDSKLASRVPFQYPVRRFIVRSREVLKPRDW